MLCPRCDDCCWVCEATGHHPVTGRKPSRIRFPLPGRPPPTTLRQTGEYIAAPAPAEQHQPHWQTAKMRFIAGPSTGRPKKVVRF